MARASAVGSRALCRVKLAHESVGDRSKRGRARFLIGAMLILGAGPAAALDGQDLLAKLRLQTERSGFVLAAERVEEAGRNLVLRGLRITATGGLDLPPLEAGELTLEGVTPRADGGYMIERIAVPDIAIDDEKSHFVLRNTVFTGCQIAPKPEGRALQDLTYCRSLAMGPAEIGAGGVPPVATFQRVTYAVREQPRDTGLTFEFRADGLSYNFEALGEAANSEEWKKVGLPKSQGSAGLKGRWSLADGRLVLEEGQLALDGFGRLAVAFDLSGYTLDALSKMQKAVDPATIDSRDTTRKPSVAAQAAMLQMFAGLTINGASLRFEEGGLTKRLFAFLAEKQSLSPPQLVTVLKIAAAGEVTKRAQMLGQPLSEAVLRAANAYLSDPRSLTVTLAPASPVPAIALLMAAQGEPEKLVTLLGVKARAND